MTTWVLLRGLTRESGHWGDFPRQLADAQPGARILTVDLPGNGPLHRQASPVSVADMLANCRAQLAQQHVAEPVHLLAMSLGAMLAVAWADAHPAELAGCVLINSSLRGVSPFHHRLRPAVWLPLLAVLARRDARAREAAILRLTSRTAPPRTVEAWTRLRERHPVSARNALRQLAAAARFRAPSRRPEVPMLILCGLGDQLVNPRCSQDLAARWGVPLAQHPSAGHDLPLDDGAWVADQARAWRAGAVDDKSTIPAGAGPAPSDCGA